VIPDVQLEGDIEALAVVGGTLSDPRFSGQAGLTEGEALIAGFPHAFEELEALALIYPGRIVLDHLTAEFAGGDLRAAGTIDLVDLAEGRLRRSPAGRRCSTSRSAFPEGFLLRGDANLTLVTRPDGQLLAGSVELERAFYLEDVPAGLGQPPAGGLPAHAARGGGGRRGARRHAAQRRRPRPGRAARAQQHRQPRGRRRPRGARHPGASGGARPSRDRRRRRASCTPTTSTRSSAAC
jgi:hypothetical protein